MKRYMLLIKLYLIKIRYKLGVLPNKGICSLVKGVSLEYYFRTWDKFSGSPVYPVPHKKLAAFAAYWSDDHKWKGENGCLRYDLLCHIIKSVKNELWAHSLDRKG